MSVLVWVLIVYMALNMVLCVYLQGKPRKPRTAADTIETLIVSGLLIYALYQALPQ